MSKIHIIAGPTASGKSARALDLAHEKSGVIINCDSMQIYDALPIITAQPSEDDKAKAPHKLYAHLHPNEDCSAGEWVRMASPIIEETLAKDQTPIICGGTGLYIKALTHGLSPMPDIPPAIRENIIYRNTHEGTPALHADLESRDPSIIGRFHPNHSARIMRALEILEATGKSITEWQALPPVPPPNHWHFETEIIIPDRSELHDRINKRFDWMIDNGALEETKTFSARIESGEINKDALICNALGFPELRAHLNDEIPLDEALEKSKASTRQYAKRQITYFKNQF